MPDVTVKNVTKKFGKCTAVDDLTLDVHHGEFVALIGPPGAGKTTVLRIIAGLETPDKGDVRIGDIVVNGLDPAERNLSMVFQSYALYPHLSVFGNIAFPLMEKKVAKSKIEEKVSGVAKTVGITHILDKSPATISGGERQRVAIARALVRDPEILLLDEPLSNLDAKLRIHMRTELKRLQEKLKLTTIMATPDQLEGLTMADRIAVIDKGRLLQYDTVDEIYDHPSCAFVAQFTGSPPMNTLGCVLQGQSGKRFLKFRDFDLPIAELRDRTEEVPLGSSLIFGIRPVDIAISTQRVSNGDSIEATIFALEPMGVDMVVDLGLGEALLRAKVPAATKLDVDQRVWISFDRNMIHIFDEKTGRAL